jgi:hypothetical protein
MFVRSRYIKTLLVFDMRIAKCQRQLSVQEIQTIEYASHKVFNKNAEKEVRRKFSLNAKYAELAINYSFEETIRWRYCNNRFSSVCLQPAKRSK